MKIEIEERDTFITVAAYWESKNPSTNNRRAPLLTTCGAGVKIAPLTLGDGPVKGFEEALAGAKIRLSEFRSEMEALDSERARMFAICRSVGEILKAEEEEE